MKSNFIPVYKLLSDFLTSHTPSPSKSIGFTRQKHTFYPPKAYLLQRKSIGFEKP